MNDDDLFTTHSSYDDESEDENLVGGESEEIEEADAI